MHIVVGVDGGATHTRAALADSTGKILGVGKSGPSNFGSVPKIKIEQHINEAIKYAFNEAGIPRCKLKSIFLGLAGILSRTDRETLRKLMEESDAISAEKVTVDHDIRISLAGGLAGKEGIALIVGTGSSCYGRTSDGSDWMAGGWGHLLDDKGSAYDLGRQGLSAIVRAADGRGPQTILTEMLMAELNLKGVKDVMPKIYVEGIDGKPMDKSSIAALAPLISKAASQGDRTALTIIQKGINELVLMVMAVADNLKFHYLPISLVLTGGTVDGSLFIKNELQKKLKNSLPDLDILEPKFSPLIGSVILALESTGIDVDNELFKNLISSK